MFLFFQIKFSGELSAWHLGTLHAPFVHLTILHYHSFDNLLLLRRNVSILAIRCGSGVHRTGPYKSDLYVGDVFGQFLLALLSLIWSYFTYLLECVSSDTRKIFFASFFFLSSQGTERMVCHDPWGISSRSSAVILFFYNHEIIFSTNILCFILDSKRLSHLSRKDDSNENIWFILKYKIGFTS